MIGGAGAMDDDHDFRVSRHVDGSTAVVVPTGEIDLLTVEAVRSELDAARRDAGVVVLDLRAVTFLDSSGLRLLVEAARDGPGDAFAVVPGPARVQQLLELTGLAGRLRFVDEPARAETR
jgi:anti-sigma B factor antagonist